MNGFFEFNLFFYGLCFRCVRRFGCAQNDKVTKNNCAL